MVIHITLWAKVSLFSDTIQLGQLRWHLGAVLTVRSLGDHFLMRVDGEINQIHGQNLVVFIDNVLMLVELNVFVFIVKVNRLEPFRQGHDLSHKFLYRATV